ncbi:predicted protein [Cyanophage PSS2]|uniref:hypothetical protein n=1 Tax=Cyanophage PSS2 TaxID=658401 RepID=UPI0001B04055|nr:hypothetical protein PSS2_gp128 [Cyanophage PSS2]ACT65690.1 hypothetical protein [Cyanophage PSS2]ACY75826.1 predicted protein [Cyanophage PSS2]
MKNTPAPPMDWAAFFREHNELNPPGYDETVKAMYAESPTTTPEQTNAKTTQNSHSSQGSPALDQNGWPERKCTPGF